MLIKSRRLSIFVFFLIFLAVVATCLIIFLPQPYFFINRAAKITVSSSKDANSLTTTGEAKDLTDYQNDYWGIKFSYPKSYDLQIAGIEASRFDHDPLFSIDLEKNNLNRLFVKIFDDPHLLPYTESNIKDYLHANYGSGDFNVGFLSSTTISQSYKITQNPTSGESLYLTIFERDRLIYVVEAILGTGQNDDAFMSKYHKVADSFEFTPVKPLPDLGLALDNYYVGGYKAYSSGVGFYRDCSFGLKCLGVSFAQDHGDLVAVDLTARYDFSKFNAISDEEKSLFSADIVNALNSQGIIGYSSNGLIYLRKGDLVYIVNVDWFMGPNRQVLKEFVIQ
jgi:hypothetical protein